MRFTTRLRKEEDGQAIILLGLAMSFFLIAAVGLGIDGSHLYSQRTMAQTAADAVAQASLMSIFDGTTSGAGFTPSDKGTFTCSASNTTATPCKYASLNGFSFAKGDTITIEFYKSSDAPLSGVALSSTDTYPVVQATISRTVNTFLMRIAGTASSTATATAIAAIVTVVSPTPLLITHPSDANVLDSDGNSTIKICGGPTQSVQVNSSSSTAYTGGVILDLSHAGPADTTGDCSKGTGASFGIFGGDSAATLGCNPTSSCTAVLLGTTGSYLQPSSPIQDPFANLSPPTQPLTAGSHASIGNGVDGCTNSGGCVEYSPGLFSGGISSTSNNTYLIFKPGIYYLLNGGLDLKNQTGGGANNNAMCVGCTADPVTGAGLLFYDTGTVSGGFANSGGFTFDTGNNIWFTGPTLTTTNSQGQTVPKGGLVSGTNYFYNIAMWEDRTAVAHTTMQFGKGNGCFQVTGTIYVTNTAAIMNADATHYQGIKYGGNPCSTTTQQGDIITGELHLNGNKAAITMNLVPYGFTQIRQVALVQ